MSTIKISELPAITGASAADTDVLPIVDTSLSTTNKITRAEFFKNVPAIDVTGDVTIADKIIHSGDTNTSIRFPAADTVTVETSGAERMRISSTGNVGIGTSSPGYKLQVEGTSGIGTSGSFVSYGQSTESSIVKLGQARTGDGYAYIDMIGDTTYSVYGLRIIRNNTGANSSSDIQHRGTAALRIQTIDAAPVTISTSNVERVRIDSSGNVLISTTDADPANNNISDAIALRADGRISARGVDNFPTMTISRGGTDGNVVVLNKGTTTVGSISVTTTATAYNTSSDYRLKEDWRPMTGASGRIMGLNPVNFAWKSNGSRVDGFLAHEVQAVVPEAVTGEKDGEEMQAIDQSKLVPLLTAALQEALTEIAGLKARITALEA